MSEFVGRSQEQKNASNPQAEFSIRLPVIPRSSDFGCLDEHLSLLAARLMRQPYIREARYNAFTTPIDADSLTWPRADLAVVKSKFCRSEEFVEQTLHRSRRGEIHGAQTVPACMEAAAIFNPEVRARGILRTHQISRPFSCELDLYVHASPLKREVFPEKERILFAHYEVDGQSVFVKGYPTNTPITRVAHINRYGELEPREVVLDRNSRDVTEVRMQFLPMSDVVKHDVLSDPRMQAYVMSDLAVQVALTMCEIDLFPDDAQRGYVARTENMSIRSLESLFSPRHEIRVKIPRNEQGVSANAVVAPIEIALWGPEGEGARLKMYFAWDKPGKEVLFGTHLRP